MEVKDTAIEKVIPYARNPRRNDAAVAAVAASIREFGFRQPIVVDEDMTVLVGHTRLKAAQSLGLAKVPVHIAKGLTESQRKAYRIADNKLNDLAVWDDEMLALELVDLQNANYDLELTGFGEEEIKKLEAMANATTDGLTDPDDVPDVDTTDTRTKLGDIWLLGKHRVMCGDSTVANDVAALMDGAKAQLVHADPPYGMGKEKDGVQNDNLYDDKLDAFQMAWWRTFRAHMEDSASAYIWGDAPGLWRLWYAGGMSASERMTWRNEIVWYKGNSGQGIKSNTNRSYPPNTERCLFFALGEQRDNINANNYWDKWEPIRSYLETEMNKCGGAKNWEAALENQMGKHYFTKSQWAFPTKEAYKNLQAFANGDAFKRDYDELKREFYATRAYFDNTHDSMFDVWEFDRVIKEKRLGHATPKPIAMIERIMRSSLEAGNVCCEPFLGSGTTLIAAETTGRICYGMEINPQYVDVTVKRWEMFTGKTAVKLEANK